jgi:hypothetical protein
MYVDVGTGYYTLGGKQTRRDAVECRLDGCSGLRTHHGDCLED